MAISIQKIRLKLETPPIVLLYRLFGKWIVQYKIMLLTTTGRKSQRRRTVPVVFMPVDSGYAVTAANLGADVHPGWYFNLQHNKQARIQVGTTSMVVFAEQPTETEGERLWEQWIRDNPAYQTAQAKTARKFPMIILKAPMTKVLVTGGTGVLGREIVSHLREAGYMVRIMSRRVRPNDVAPEIDWVQADLETGDGVEQAVAGIEVVVHAASRISLVRDSKQGDILGTQRLLAAAYKAELAHLIYISIVGIHRIPYPYYHRKLEAEGLIRASAIPSRLISHREFATPLKMPDISCLTAPH